MYVGNCTDEDADYTVDNGGGDKHLIPHSFKKDPRLAAGRTVKFYVDSNTNLAHQIQLDSGDVILILHRSASGTYYSEILYQQ